MLKQQEFLNEFNFKFFNASETDVRKKSKIFCFIKHCVLCENTMQVKGKSTFKDEFVTAGGVDLKEIDFKTMRSKTLENFYIAGEVLNIDAITGGFNFQACWSEAWLIAQDLNSKH